MMIDPIYKGKLKSVIRTFAVEKKYVSGINFIASNY
jgi:hypothetical protein